MFQKHLSLTLGIKLNFLGSLEKFQSVLPRLSLLTVYKTFDRSQLDYSNTYNSYLYTT